jgi:hypothetical protein
MTPSEQFDPERHEVDETGKAVLTKKGSYKLRKEVRAAILRENALKARLANQSQQAVRVSLPTSFTELETEELLPDETSPKGEIEEESKSIALTEDSVQDPPDRDESKPKVDERTATQASKATVDAIASIWSYIGGADNAQPTKDERKRMEEALTQYYVARGIIKTPPEIGLIVTIGPYLMARWNLPEPKQRRETFLQWLKSKMRKP